MTITDFIFVGSAALALAVATYLLISGNGRAFLTPRDIRSTGSAAAVRWWGGAWLVSSAFLFLWGPPYGHLSSTLISEPPVSLSEVLALATLVGIVVCISVSRASARRAGANGEARMT